MDSKNPRQTEVTVDSIAADIEKEFQLSKERFDHDMDAIDQVLPLLTDTKDIFILNMLKSLSQNIFLTAQSQTINGLSFSILLLKAKKDSTESNTVQQLKEKIAKIEETYSPVIENMREAFENKKKWLGENI